ncbi:hypothetical protein C8R45DRAFT_848875, partial [Mycena sanguinolenta]
ELARFKTFSARYISALEQEQAELEAKLNNIVYPVLSLPTEITTRIFVECLPDDGATSLAECAPLLLMRVCRQWKDITLSSCQLWSSLRIESYSRDKIMVPRGTLEMLQTWFSRARARPLALTVTYNYSSMSEVALSVFHASYCLISQ